MSPISDDQFTPRKVRCPNCKEVLTEPQGQIYECPNCLTLLLAKPSSRGTNRSRSSISRPSQNRGIEGIQQAAEADKERRTDDQVQQGNVSTGMEQSHISKISLESNKEEVPSRPPDENVDDKSDKGSHSGGDSCLGVIPEVHVGCSDEVSENAIDMSHEEQITTGLINSNYPVGNNFGMDFDNDKRNGQMQTLDEKPWGGNDEKPVGRVRNLFDLTVFGIYDEKPYLEMERGKDVHFSTLSENDSECSIDKAAPVEHLDKMQFQSSHSELDFSEHRQSQNDTMCMDHSGVSDPLEKEIFNTMSTHQEHTEDIDSKPSPSEQDFPEHNKPHDDNLSEDHSGMTDLPQNETTRISTDSTETPLENIPSENHTPDKLVTGASINSPESLSGTGQMSFADGDEDEIDKDALVSSHYSDVMDIAPQVSFGDWRSQQVLTAAKEKYSSVKDKRMLKTNLDAQSESSWDEDEDVTFPKPLKEEETNIRSDATQSTTSPEKHPLPLRTAAMQKFLQNAPKQGRVPQKTVDESQQMIYEAPYVFNNIPVATKTKLEPREETSIPMSEKHLYETVNLMLVTNTAGSTALDGPDTDHQKVSPGSKGRPSPTKEQLRKDIARWNDKNVSCVEEYELEKGSINEENVERKDQTEMGKMNLEKEMTGRMEATPNTLVWKGKDVQRTTERSPVRDDRTQGMQLVLTSEPERDMIPVPGSQWNYDPNTNRRYNSRRTKPQKSKAEHNTDAWNRPMVRDQLSDLDSFQYRLDMSRQPGMTIHDLHPIGVPLDDDQYAIPPETLMGTRSNRESLHGSYGLPMQRNTGYPFTGSSHPGIAVNHLPEPIHNNSAHYCASPVHPVRQQQYHVQQPQMPPSVALHAYGSSASPSPRAVYDTHGFPMHPSNSRPVPLSRRQNRTKSYSQYPAVVPSKPKLYPPLPEKGAPPYVFCKGCNQILQLPSYIPPNTGPVQKLQCSNCRKISRFSVSLQASALSSWSSMRGSTVNSYKFFNSPSVNERATVPGFVQSPYSYGPVREAQKSVRDRSATTSPQDWDVSVKEHSAHGNECRAMVSFGHEYARQASRSESDSHHSNGVIQSEGYLSSSPSSASGSSPWRNYQDADVPRSELTSLFNENLRLDKLSTAPRYHESDPVLHREAYSHQRIYHGSFSENPYNRQLETDDQGFQAASWQKQHGSSDNYRNSPMKNNPDFRQTSVAPGSPLRSNFDAYQAPNHRAPSWSPSPGSPLFDHSSQPAGSESRRSPSPQDVSKGPKYYAGLLKKGLKDLGKGGHRNPHRGRVYVNGQLIPEAAVRKAEERAGVINPGEYWYDYEAGFWGAMRGPCLGIIMPYIEEFSIPMVKDCAGGKTGILVNGRELHEKDLEALVKRGLPTLPGKAYRVEINGKVVDETTGQQLKSLGRLAPSVEKKGCGFGMWQPSPGT